MFIMIDGIDGSGKSTIIDAWKKNFEENGKKVFNIKEFWNEHGAHPIPKDAADADIVFSAEPTTVWVGAAIRKEIIANDTSYTGFATAAAYSLDRLILYKRLIIPLLEQGKTVIQDRGISTSLCYQPIQDPNLTMDIINGLEGNKRAREHRPDQLVIADVSPQIALSRLGRREDKKDDAQFEQEDFLEKAQNMFLSEQFQNNFTSRGTQIHKLKTDSSIDIMTQDALSLLKSLI